MISFKNPRLDRIDVNDKSEVLSIFHKQGFVIIDGNSFGDKEFNADERLKHIEKKYLLGEFEPSDDNVNLYGERLKDAGYNHIGRPGVDVKLDHDAFDSCNGQEAHVDGIFRPSGEIQTVALTCKSEAAQGGENTLFNVIGAIEHIRKMNPELVLPLYDKRSMRRVSNYEGNDRHSLDAILSYDEKYQREIINFSTDSTVDWDFSEKFVPNLKTPVSLLKTLIKEKEFRLEVLLRTGDTIIMDNGLIAHGRKAFVDSEENPRIMVRGKYPKMPS